jgi:signal transduction histidine kinase
VTALAIAAALSWFPGWTFTPLFSVPVVFAALVEGWRGGIAAAVVSSVVIFTQPGGSRMEDRALAAVVLILLGILVGAAVNRSRRERKHLQETVDELSSVYEKVQASFEGMKRAERLSAIGQLSAGLAHEIRNPLASIAGAAAILQRTGNMEPKHVKCIEIITNECARLNGLLTNFLNFARPRAPRFQTVNLDSVLDNVVGLASHGLNGKRVSCEKQIGTSLPQVECDPEQLEQVLLNLMINAIEASPNGEVVTVSAGADDKSVAIHVIDRGHGVAPAHVDRLFDPFFTTKEHGTGLGLSVAHQITTQMGGRLLAKRNPERGMTFSVILPAKHENS